MALSHTSIINPSSISQTIKKVWKLHDSGAFSNILNTPFYRAEKIGHNLGCDLYIKLENMQMTGSFKERGALSKLLSLTPKEKAKGVIAASAGNHAQGLARHAKLLGVSALIVMPEHTPIVKVQATEYWGAKVVLAGETFEDAKDVCDKLALEQDRTLVPPFEDFHVIAGQSTLIKEMLNKVPDLDVIVAPIGGGGLLAGLAAGAKILKPDIEVIGVQSALFPAMLNAIDGNNRPIGGNTLAEGISVRKPGELTKRIIQKFVNDYILVDEHALERAVNVYLNDLKQNAEGAGAAGLAAILGSPERFVGKKVGTVLTGGNIDARLLSSIILRGLARSGRMSRLRIELIDVPGQLVKVSQVISEARGNVIDVAYHRIFSNLPAKITNIDISVEAYDSNHMNKILDALQEKGFQVQIADY